MPSDYARAAKKQGFDIITWTLERSGPLATTGRTDYYYQSITPAIDNDGDTYKLLDVLARQVHIRGIFSDWAGTVTSTRTACASASERPPDVGAWRVAGRSRRAHRLGWCAPRRSGASRRRKWPSDAPFRPLPKEKYPGTACKMAILPSCVCRIAKTGSTEAGFRPSLGPLSEERGIHRG